MYVAKEDFIVNQCQVDGSSPGLRGVHGPRRRRSSQVRKTKSALEADQCSNVVGVDRSGAEIEQMRKLGIFDNVVLGDVERLDELATNQKFDVVIAGEIIEHLSNPGRMLDGIKRFCRADTRVIITTPNAFGAPNYLRYSAGRFREGAEHVMTFNEHNLVTLLRRAWIHHR
jgi:2-polyprenyl-3-methyl-5-hydroxy-6-metoxy-1,4-benzoquinol methylase